MDCIICFEPLFSMDPDSPAPAALAPCGHVCHQTCVMQWIEIRKECPMCKAKCQPRDVLNMKLSYTPSQLKVDRMDLTNINVMAKEEEELMKKSRIEEKEIRQELNALKREEVVLLRKEKDTSSLLIHLDNQRKRKLAERTRYREKLQRLPEQNEREAKVSEKVFEAKENGRLDDICIDAKQEFHAKNERIAAQRIDEDIHDKGRFKHSLQENSERLKMKLAQRESLGFVTKTRIEKLRPVADEITQELKSQQKYLKSLNIKKVHLMESISQIESAVREQKQKLELANNKTNGKLKKSNTNSSEVTNNNNNQMNGTTNNNNTNSIIDDEFDFILDEDDNGNGNSMEPPKKKKKLNTFKSLLDESFSGSSELDFGIDEDTANSILSLTQKKPISQFITGKSSFAHRKLKKRKAPKSTSFLARVQEQ